MADTGGREVRAVCKKTGPVRTGNVQGGGNPIRKDGKIFGNWQDRKKSGKQPKV